MSNLLTCANTLNSGSYLDSAFHNDIKHDMFNPWIPSITSTKNSSNSLFGFPQQSSNDIEGFDYSSPEDESLFKSFFPFLEDCEEKSNDLQTNIYDGIIESSKINNSNFCDLTTLSNGNILCPTLLSSVNAIDHMSLEKAMLDQNTKPVLDSKAKCGVTEINRKNGTIANEVNNMSTVIDRFKKPINFSNQDKDKFTSWNPFGSQSLITPVSEVTKHDISVKAIGSEMSHAKKMGLIKNESNHIHHYEVSPTEVLNNVQTATLPSNRNLNMDQELINTLSKLILTNNLTGSQGKLTDNLVSNHVGTNLFKLPSPINLVSSANTTETAVPQDLMEFLKFFTASGLIPDQLLKPKYMNASFFTAAKQFMQLCKAYAGLLAEIQKGNSDVKSLLLLEMLQTEIRRGRDKLIGQLTTAHLASLPTAPISSSVRQQSTCWLRLSNFPISDPPAVKSLLGQFGRIVELRNQDGCKYAVKFSNDLELMAAWSSLSQSSSSYPRQYQADLVNDLGEVILR